MRTLIFFVASILGSRLAAATGPAADAEEFDMGGRIAQCLLVKCQVFRGTLITDSPQSGKPIKVHVDEWLFGKPSAPQEAIDIPYEAVDNDDSYESPYKGRWIAQAWSKVTTLNNLRVTIVLALEHGLGTWPGDPAEITSSEQDLAKIRSVLANAAKLKAQPGLVSELVASLSREPDPSLAGYLLIRLYVQTSSTDKELATALLLQMLDNPSVPGVRTEFVASVLGSYCLGVSAALKAQVTQRFLDFGQQSDVDNARAAYVGLAKIASLDPSLPDTIPPESLKAIANTYRGLVKSGRIKRNSSLETGLRIKLQ